jgi:hypothetical protein
MEFAKLQKSTYTPEDINKIEAWCKNPFTKPFTDIFIKDKVNNLLMLTELFKEGDDQSKLISQAINSITSGKQLNQEIIKVIQLWLGDKARESESKLDTFRQPFSIAIMPKIANWCDEPFIAYLPDDTKLEIAVLQRMIDDYAQNKNLSRDIVLEAQVRTVAHALNAQAMSSLKLAGNDLKAADTAPKTVEPEKPSNEGRSNTIPSKSVAQMFKKTDSLSPTTSQIEPWYKKKRPPQLEIPAKKSTPEASPEITIIHPK